MNAKIQQLEEQIRAYGKRREDLHAQLAKAAADQQAQKERLATIMLDGGSSKDVEKFRAEWRQAEGLQQALEMAILEADRRINALTAEQIAEQRTLAEEQYSALAHEMTDDITDAVKKIYAANESLETLIIRFMELKKIGDPYGIVAAGFLPPDIAEGVESIKWMRALELSHRLEVFKKHYPSLAAMIKG